MPITFEAERLAYYNEYGRAIGAWAYVEQLLVFVAGAFYPEGIARNMLGVGMTGITGFHSKLRFVDRSVTRGMAGLPKVFQDRWERIVDELDALSTKRNELAHWVTRPFEKNKTEGRRIALCDWLQTKGADTEQPLPGSYCVSELIRTRREFTRAISRLENFFRMLLELKELPEEFAKPDENLPTIQETIDQMCAELGHPRQSAKQRKREEDARNAAQSLINHPMVKTDAKTNGQDTVA